MTTSIRAAAKGLARLALLSAGLALFASPAAAADSAAEADATANAALLAALETYADAVAADLDAYWAERLSESGVAYRSPEVVFFTETVRTCGAELVPGVTVTAFYCPLEERVYIDGVDHVAVAEVFGRGWLSSALAHEWGHHVQTLLGLPVARANKPESVSIRLELQADCLAGGWTAEADARGLIDADAVDVTVYVLAYLGSPPLQGVGLNGGHGGSEQRVRAFLLGYDDGTEACLA